MECLALGRGRPGFTQNFTGSALLGKSFARPRDFVYRSFTFYGSSFQRDSTIARYGNSLPGLAPRPKAPATPTAHRRKAVACSWFRLFPFRSPLLRESLRFLLLRLLRCFSSAAYLYPRYVFTRELHDSVMQGCPIRISPDQSLLAAPRSFSSLATSFIGSKCQGIHRAPFLT